MFLPYIPETKLWGASSGCCLPTVDPNQLFGLITPTNRIQEESVDSSIRIGTITHDLAPSLIPSGVVFDQPTGVMSVITPPLQENAWTGPPATVVESPTI